MDKLKIAVLFGGTGEEHPVSVKSACEVEKSLDRDKYEPYFIGISKSGAWSLCYAPSPDWEDKKGPPVLLSPEKGQELLILDGFETRAVSMDAAFPVLHGNMGEDGSIQGLLKLYGIPCLGCDVQSSILCMDKSLAYIAAEKAGIKTPRHWIAGDDTGPEEGDFPVFVKPARSGSSFGITKVSSRDKLSEAIRLAAQYDSKVLIEETVCGMEIGCSVLEDGTELITGELDQITLSGGFFRIHQEKNPEQGSENATIRVPAEISPESTELVKETAKKVFRALGCRGLSRVDMFLTEDGQVILNEINTMPGLTCYSRYPRMMAASGLSLSDIIDRLVTQAIKEERHD